jgi:hypothetical protein
MAKRGRPRKLPNGTPPPPDRNEFEQSRELVLYRPATVNGADAAPLLAAPDRRAFESKLQKLANPFDDQPSQTLHSSEASASSGAPSAGPETQRLIVPMICSKHDKAFALEFQKTTASWLFHAVVQLNSKSSELPVNQNEIDISTISFNGSLCPSCGATCSPIECGSCNRLGCQGGRDGNMYRCPCGSSGLITGQIEKVSTLGTAAASSPTPGRQLIFSSKR